MKLNLLVVSSLFGVAATPASAFDDPAVALCEYAVRSELGPLQVYNRTSANMTGLVVQITYTIQVLNTKPKTATARCPFVFDEREGGFILKMPPMGEKPECTIERATFARWMTELRKQNPEATAGLTQARRDLAQCTAAGIADSSQLREWARSMLETGIYPIVPEDTDLGK